MKHAKQCLSILLVLLMLCTSVPLVFSATVDSGTCGDNVMWTLDDTGTLTISGTGEMDDYYLNTPWEQNKDLIKSVIIQDGVTSIGKYAFYECESLESATMGNYVKTIALGAFRGCTCLDEVTMSSSIETISAQAFAFCTSLSSISIPSSIANISSTAFVKCSALNQVFIESLWSYLDSTVSFDSKTGEDMIFHYPFDLYLNNDLVTKCNIPEGVSGAYFKLTNCISITSVIVPNETKGIGYKEFYNCSSLKEVSLPNSINNIGLSAFYKCDSLTDVFYEGTENQWNAIVIDHRYNEPLTAANIHYNYNHNPIFSHSVTYNYSANGGTSATASTATVAEGVAIDLTPTAAKSGWTFVGWNTNANATTALSSLTMNTSDVTLYAIYKKTLTGTFIDYSGTSKTTRTASTTIYNKATSGTVSAPAQNTYTGWSTRGWATGTAADASTASSFTISANTTYYGTYQRTLTLSYNANGGSSTPSSRTGTQYANSYSISSTKNPSFTLANAISKSGSTFDGWAMGSTSGTKYAAGSSVSVSANTTMYATWKTTPVNIYNLGEETYSFPNYGDTDSRGGHCFGMSSTSSMYYLKRIDISRVGGAGNNLYALSDNAMVRKPICYYQGQQEHALDATVAGGTYYRYGRYNISSDWNEVVNYVKSHNYDDKGTLQIGYRSNGLGGHAINFLRYAVENGQERIYAYDNNFPTTETYFYKDANGRIKQAPKATFGDGSIDCICLRDMSLFRTLAGDFSNSSDDSVRKIYADRDAINVDDILAYPIDGDVEMQERVLYFIPENETQVRITPNVDNATFTYCDEEYNFGKISDETYGVLTLKSMDEHAGTDQAQFTIMNAPNDEIPPEQNRCPWCGGQHEGFFQKIVGFFHRILAAIFGAKY